MVVSPAGTWSHHASRDSPVPLAMAAVVAQGQLTATPITNPFGLAGAAGMAADNLAQAGASLARGQPGSGTGLPGGSVRISCGVERQQLR